MIREDGRVPELERTGNYVVMTVPKLLSQHSQGGNEETRKNLSLVSRYLGEDTNRALLGNKSDILPLASTLSERCSRYWFKQVCDLCVMCML
jgi:hypothetical protein